MDERKVRRIDEIFDGTESIRLEYVGPCVELAEICILPFGKDRNAVFRSTERRPHHAVTLFGGMREGSCLQGRRLIRRGGYEYAFCRTVVAPTVIGTYDLIVGDPAFGKARAAMDAEVFPDMNSSLGVAPKDEILAKQRGRQPPRQPAHPC